MHLIMLYYIWIIYWVLYVCTGICLCMEPQTVNLWFWCNFAILCMYICTGIQSENKLLSIYLRCGKHCCWYMKYHILIEIKSSEFVACVSCILVCAYTVQITFIFICQTHLVFGKCVCTCVKKHSNAFRTSLNWLTNLKCIWLEPEIHILCLPRFGNCDLWAFGGFSFIQN